jgi:glutamate-1-semialdehyde 2,1-aminomutase
MGIAAALVSRNQDLDSALAEAEERYSAANPTSKRLHQEAHGHLPGGNTRTTVHFSPFPLYMASGEGSRLTDADGHVYSDFINEYTAGVFGHSNPVIAATIAETLASGINFGAPTRYEAMLSAEVRRRFPAMELLRFCNSGTEANLLAMAAARAVTGKEAVLVFDGAYHGSLFYFGHGPSPLNMPIPFVASEFNNIDAMRRDVSANAHRLAAVIVEPMQGGAGALPAHPAFIKALREVTAAHDVLLIVDEVMTSRTHFGGMQEHFGLTPDLVTLGKYLAGGLTIGAFGGRADVMNRFDPAHPHAIPHGGTFNNNVLAMAAGHAALSKVLTPAAVERMNTLGERLRQRLNQLAMQYRLPMMATGHGSVFGIHFHDGPVRNANDLDRGEAGREKAIAGLKKLFHLDMIAAGIYLSRRILGCLSVETSENEADAFAAATEEFLVSRGQLIGAAFSRP